jgi:hypothetical protein
MHHGANLDNNFHSNFVKDDGSYPNLTLCYGVNAHTNDIIVQQNIILIGKSCHISIIPTKALRSTTFNNKISMKSYTYIRETIKNNPSHQKFQIFLKSWNLDYMILKCSLVFYGINDFFTLENILPLKIYLG